MTNQEILEEFEAIKKLQMRMNKRWSNIVTHLLKQNEELAEQKRKLERVILSEDNANRKGGPSKLSDADIAWLKEQRESGMSVTEIARLFDITRQTVYNILKRDYAKAAHEYAMRAPSLGTLKDDQEY